MYEAAAVRTEDLYRFLVESTTEYAIFAMSLDGTIVSWNTGAENVFGYTRAAMLNRRFDAIFTEEDRAQYQPAQELQTARVNGRSVNDRWHVRSDGTRFWATNTVQPMRNEGGEIVGYTKIVRDTTERYTSLHALRESEARFRTLVETVEDYALFGISPEGKIDLWNAGAERLFRLRPDEILGKHYRELYTSEDADDGIPDAELSEATAEGVCLTERWLVRGDGSRFYSSGRLARVRGAVLESERGFVRVAHDESERRTREEAMHFLAFHDSLTALPNRAAFLERLACEIEKRRLVPERLFAVYFLDVDDFKTINDTFGHMAADRVLVALAGRLDAIVRDGDVVARIGGDEFAMLVTDLRDSMECHALVERVAASLALPFQIDAQDTYLTMSVGIALDRPSYTEPEEPLRDADLALYVAKAAGRAKHAIFEPSMRERIVASKNLETQIHHALDRAELRIVYQPIIDLQSLRTVGFEALVR